MTILRTLSKKSSLLNGIFFSLLGVAELVVVRTLSDLTPEIANWSLKAHEILNLQVPTNNFYGPGAAILTLPFLWNAPSFQMANVTYFFIGCFFFFQISSIIDNRKIRFLTRSTLLINPYLIWLCDSSQDTVFEFALLSLALFLIVRKRYLISFLPTFILAETRSQYWIFFLGLGAILFLGDKERKNRRLLYLTPFALMLLVGLFNQIQYKSPSPALEGGVTLEMSYSPYYYLAHPKYDVDYLLGGPDGPIESNKINPSVSPFDAEGNKYYSKLAIKLAIENPKETILGTMQKIDSYIFSSQKIPNLPGYYKLNPTTNEIRTVDSRLHWNLVIGALLFQILRGVMFIGFLLSMGVVISRRIRVKSSVQEHPEFWLIAPWLLSLPVGILVYTESRFKVIPELFIFIFIGITFSKLLRERAADKEVTE